MTTTISQSGVANEAVRSTRPDYLEAAHGLRSWLFTQDHKRISVMYLGSVCFTLLIGGVLALLIRIEHLTPQRTIVSDETYTQLFTMHGVVMIFLFLIPSIPSALGNFLVPLMLGSKDVAFPRLNLFSLYVYWVGSAMVLGSLFSGGVDTGWTFYTPFSTSSVTHVSLVGLGIFIVGFSSIFTGLNFIVTIQTMRAPGMTMFRMPLFLWSLYATGFIQVIGTPVLAITLLLLIYEKVFHVGIFDARLGGDPVLFQHFFWFYSHPAVYIMILPAFGVMSEVIPTFSRKTIFGYRMICFATMAIALVGFLVWGHHMFIAGQSQLAAIIFSFLTFVVAIPSAIKVWNWLATMYRGSISFGTPMLYALSFLLLFTIGGLTGIFLGTLAIDVHLTDTYFVVAHFHYVMMGGTVFALLAGIHYWWPKITGRLYSQGWGAAACALNFIGFNLTFFPQFIMGSRGMPRRYYNYFPRFQPFHVASTIGSWIMAIGMVTVLVYFLVSLRRGQQAPANPWGGTTLEWTVPSPPPVENFEKQPVVKRDPYDYRQEAV